MRKACLGLLRNALRLREARDRQGLTEYMWGYRYRLPIVSFCLLCSSISSSFQILTLTTGNSDY